MAQIFPFSKNLTSSLASQPFSIYTSERVQKGRDKGVKGMLGWLSLYLVVAFGWRKFSNLGVKSKFPCKYVVVIEPFMNFGIRNPIKIQDFEGSLLVSCAKHTR